MMQNSDLVFASKASAHDRPLPRDEFPRSSHLHAFAYSANLLLYFLYGASMIISATEARAIKEPNTTLDWTPGPVVVMSTVLVLLAILSFTLATVIIRVFSRTLRLPVEIPLEDSRALSTRTLQIRVPTDASRTDFEMLWYVGTSEIDGAHVVKIVQSVVHDSTKPEERAFVIPSLPSITPTTVFYLSLEDIPSTQPQSLHSAVFEPSAPAELPATRRRDQCGELDPVKVFTEAIVKEDMLSCNNDHLKGLMASPKLLPVDSVSQPGTVMIQTHLMDTVGDDTAILYRMLCDNALKSLQDRRLFCAAATTGVGKTQQAYAVALQHPVLTIVIRVADGTGTFTWPWRFLRDTLEPFNALSLKFIQHNDLDSFKRMAVSALHIIKLFLCVYVELTLRVVEHAHSKFGDRLSPSQFRELALRFHRNGRAEQAVANLFEERLQQFRDGTPTAPVPGCVQLPVSIDEKSLRIYRDDLSKRAGNVMPGAIVLLCLDEVGGFFSHRNRDLPDLFISSTEYCRLFTARNDVSRSHSSTGLSQQSSPKEEDLGIQSLSLVEIQENTSRGIFYGVGLAMASLLQNCNWQIYMTCSSLNVANFSINETFVSPIRSSTTMFIPHYYFTVPAMLEYIQRYFHVDPAVLQPTGSYPCNGDVYAALRMLEGRPLFFANDFFTKIFEKTLGPSSSQTSLSVQVDDIVDAAKAAVDFRFRDLLLILQRQMLPAGPFAHSAALVLDTDRSTLAYLPFLIGAVLFHNGRFFAPEIRKGDVNRVLASALASGLFFQADPQFPDQMIDMRAEPLVWKVCESFVKSFVLASGESGSGEYPGTAFSSYFDMRILTSPVLGAAKGYNAETTLPEFISLRVHWHLFKTSESNMGLGELLVPLFSGPGEIRARLRADLNSWRCDARELFDLQLKREECEFESFFTVDDEGVITYHTNRILVNFRDSCGVDIAFLAFTPSKTPETKAHGEICVVALQLKNKKEGTFADAMLTLHPGTQFLDNSLRRSLISSRSLEAEPRNSVLLEQYLACARKAPCLFKNWIRCPVVARVVHKKVYDKAETMRLKVAEVEASPVVILSLNSSNWLNESLRSRILTQGASSSTLSLPQSEPIEQHILPVTIEDLQRALKDLKANKEGSSTSSRAAVKKK